MKAMFYEKYNTVKMKRKIKENQCQIKRLGGKRESATHSFPEVP
jgi:hypothetical protein